MFRPFKTKVSEETANFGRFTIEPLNQGYGHTLGNSLRRVLLSSLPGAAVTYAKISGVRHPFSTISGMKEDVVEFLLNLKKLRIKIAGEKPVKLKLEAKGPKTVTAKDIKLPADAEIANPDLYLASLSDNKSKLSVEITVENGAGYILAEERKTAEIGLIPVDSQFSPVVKVNYTVEPTRVGRITNLDRLVLEITTDGTISPAQALNESSKMLVRYLRFIYEPQEVAVEEDLGLAAEIPEETLKMTIEELDLAPKVTNCLARKGVKTVGDLITLRRKDLLKVKNLGSKSVTQIEERLSRLSLGLSG